jgi:hypothetical protein
MRRRCLPARMRLKKRRSTASCSKAPCAACSQIKKSGTNHAAGRHDHDSESRSKPDNRKAYSMTDIASNNAGQRAACNRPCPRLRATTPLTPRGLHVWAPDALHGLHGGRTGVARQLHARTAILWRKKKRPHPRRSTIDRSIVEPSGPASASNRKPHDKQSRGRWLETQVNRRYCSISAICVGNVSAGFVAGAMGAIGGWTVYGSGEMRAWRWLATWWQHQTPKDPAGGAGRGKSGRRPIFDLSLRIRGFVQTFAV